MLLGLLFLPALVFGAASEASVDNPERTIAVSTCSIKRPDTRILVLEDSFKYCKILSETPSSSSALLKLDMVNHFQLGYQVFSIPALDMCLEYQTFPDRFAAIEKKREFLGKLFDLGIRNGKSAELISALKHTLCKDTLKDLGSALSLIQLKWLNKFAYEVLFENIELLASLNDYSWITLDRFNEFMQTQSSYILNWMRIKAFIATANEDVLTEAMFYHFHPSMKDQVLALRPDFLTLERLEKDIRLYPVAVLANLLEMDYIGSKLICTDLNKNGLTRYNLAAILLYVQMTDFICLNELNQIGFAWCKAHEGFSTEVEESLETTKARHAAFSEAIQPHLNILLGINENRQALWEEVQKISACEEAIAKFKPEWKESLHLILRNPANMFLRLALSNWSNLALHLPIHPDDYDLEIPLPRCIFTGPQPPIFIQATSPFLINSVLRNVFFLDGESWREDALREGVDLTSQSAVSEFLRNKMNFFYSHSTEPPLHSEILQIHFKFRLICRGIVATGPLAVRFYAENLSFSPDAKENEKLSSIYEHVLSNIIIRSFTEADLDLFDRFFKGNQNLVDLVEGIRNDLQAEVEDYPFHGEGIIMHYLQANCSIVRKVDAELNELWKVFTGPDAQCHVKQLNLMRGVQVVSNLMLGLGPKLTPPILLELWSKSETFRVLSAHQNILSRSQFKSLFDLEIGKTFLTLNQLFVVKMKDFSFLSEELLLSSKVELRDLEASLTSLPLSARKSLFFCSDQKAFQYPARVAIVLGADFWHLPEIRSHQQAWEMIDLIAIHADAFRNEYDFLSLIMEIVPKLPDSLEEAKPMILRIERVPLNLIRLTPT